MHVVSKAPKPSSQTKETEASKYKTDQSETETKSSLTKDKSPSHPSPPTLVVGEMHKEAQQAAGGLTSLGATNKTKPARDGLKTAHTNSGTNEESRVDDISKKIKLEDLSEFLKDTRSTFFTHDSPQDDPIIVTYESEEEEDDKEDTHDTSHDVPQDTLVPPPPSLKVAQIQVLMAQVQLLNSQNDELEQQKAIAKVEVASLKARPLYPNINQPTDILVTSLKPKLSKLLASHNFAICLPTELKELPSKFNELSREIKELKQHVKDMEIELTSCILSSRKAHGFRFSSKSTEILNRFATVVEISSRATTTDVPSTSQATALPVEGEKNTKNAETNLKDELV
ncbi:hypothetical protein Tco_1536357, partial [Tanacetum coccineum]